MNDRTLNLHLGFEPAGGRNENALTGEVSSISADGHLEGWAIDVSSPQRPVEVRALDGDRLLSTGIANKFRTDPSPAGWGSGSVGFSLVLPDDVFDGSVHLIKIVARSFTSGATRLIDTVKELLPSRHLQSDSVDATFVGLSLQPPQKDRKRPIQDVRTEFLSKALKTALARVDELERSQREMTADRELLRAQLRSYAERFSKDLAEFSGTPWAPRPSSYLGSVVQTLSITRRRDHWLRELADRGLSGPVYSTMPHDGAPGGLTILVWGSGGIGDMLYTTSIVRELGTQFANSRIYVLNENPAVEEVFRHNPHVSGTMTLQGEKLYDFVHSLHSYDVFDLIAEVRYCVTYTVSPLSRVPQDFLRLAGFRSAEWQKFIRYRWPHLNNIFANEVMAKGLSKLDLVGMTSLLPIRSSSELDFFLVEMGLEFAQGLRGERFATIHHGSDKNMSGAGGVQTKNLPVETWQRIVRIMSDAGLTIVQLGESHEALVDGIHVDMRGRTSLQQTAYILKMASVHVDSEGGLVHLARAMQTRSVVIFGPTPVGFFGYPQNHNIAPPLCGNCWWTTDRWATQCPLETVVPQCMASQSAEFIAERAIELADETHVFMVEESQLIGSGAMNNHVKRWAADVQSTASRGAVLIGTGADIQSFAEIGDGQGEITLLVPTAKLATTVEWCGANRHVSPYGHGCISRNTGSLDWIIGLFGSPMDSDFLPACMEIARCVRIGGHALILAEMHSNLRIEDVREAVLQRASQLIGSKFKVVWANVDEGDTINLLNGDVPWLRLELNSILNPEYSASDPVNNVATAVACGSME